MLGLLCKKIEVVKTSWEDERAEIAKTLGLTETDVENVGKMSSKEFLKIPDPERKEIGLEGSAVIVEVASKIQDIEVPWAVGEDKNTEKAVEVIDERGVKCYYVLSSKSSKMQFFKAIEYFKKELGTDIVGQKIAISKVWYKHDTWGLTLAHRIRPIEEKNKEEIKNESEDENRISE